jgi:hypothetical protein
LGCDLPKTPTDDPAQWESKVMMDLNDEILASVGSNWQSWEPFDENWYASSAIEEFYKRAQIALRNEFGASPLFVLKDPRICRLLNFWIEAVRRFGATPVVVIPIRNPVEVAGSLEVRDGIHLCLGQLLWLRYVLDAEKASRKLRRAFLRYDDLLSDWQSVADRLGHELGISWPRHPSSAKLEIGEYISPAKRHHRNENLKNFEGPWVRSTFEILVRWAEGRINGADNLMLDQIRSDFDEASLTFIRPIATAIAADRSSKKSTTKLEADFKAKLAAHERALQEIKNSTSWRLTAPLRALSRCVRKILQGPTRMSETPPPARGETAG